MAITETQRQNRKQYIGSSDVAAILGLDPYKTPYEIWCKMVYNMETEESSDKALLGLDFEKILVEWLSRKLNKEIITDPLSLEFIDSTGIFVSHPDGIIKDLPEGVEVKMTQIADDWETEGTDMIPRHFWLQCQAHCYCGNFKCVHVAVMLINFYGYQIKYYRVDRNEKVIEEMVKKCTEFYNENVLKQIPPSGNLPPLQVFQKIKRVPEKFVEIDEKLVSAYETAKEYVKEANKALDGTQALIMRQLGDAEGARLSDGRILTFMEMKRSGYMVQDTKYRQLKITKEK